MSTESNIIRTNLKMAGYNRNHVSVQSPHSSSVMVTIKKTGVDFDLVKRIASAQEHYERCQSSGEILCGGNTFVTVEYDRQMVKAKAEPIALLLEDINPDERDILPVCGDYNVSRNWSNGFTLSKAGKNLSDAYSKSDLARCIVIDALKNNIAV